MILPHSCGRFFLFVEAYGNVTDGFPSKGGFVIDGLFVTCEKLKIVSNKSIACGSLSEMIVDGVDFLLILLAPFNAVVAHKAS